MQNRKKIKELLWGGVISLVSPLVCCILDQVTSLHAKSLIIFFLLINLVRLQLPYRIYNRVYIIFLSEGFISIDWTHWFVCFLYLGEILVSECVCSESHVRMQSVYFDKTEEYVFRKTNVFVFPWYSLKRVQFVFITQCQKDVRILSRWVTILFNKCFLLTDFLDLSLTDEFPLILFLYPVLFCLVIYRSILPDFCW